MYPAAGHIMTGNLKIISDSRIRYIVSKGPKYRFPSRINFKKCREEIASALNDFGNRKFSIFGYLYISQLIRFARVSSHVVDFNARNKSLTNKLLQQGYRYHKLRKTFSKFYRRHYELVSKFNVGLKTLLHQGLSEPEFYGDLVYKFKKIVGRADFSDHSVLCGRGNF